MRPTQPTQQVAIGGRLEGLCTICGGRLHRLLQFDPAPEHLALGVGVATIAVCLSCLGFEAYKLFYAHTAYGTVECLQGGNGKRQPEFPAATLLGATATLHAAEPRWFYQDWGASNGRQNLNRIGGPPTWVQYAEYHPCPKCAETMCFILQLDADLFDEDGGQRDWGNGGGICYVLWCRTCSISCLFSQFT